MENINEPQALTQDKDWFLELLVSVVNKNDNGSLEVTLTVGGFLVTGSLISNKEYFRLLGKEFNADNEKGFSGIIDHLNNQKSESKISVAYIHLKDAFFVIPGPKPIPTNKGVLWRGKLSDVSGFNIGTLSVPKELTE